MVRRVGTVMVFGWAAVATSILALDATGPRTSAAAMEGGLAQLVAEDPALGRDEALGELGL